MRAKSPIRFGTAVSNPDLKPERAVNFEIGGDRKIRSFNLSGALFYSDLSDALVSVRTPANLNRRENYGSARYYGGELSIDAKLGSALDAGINYSYIHRDFDVGETLDGVIRPFRLTDVPSHKGFAYVAWRPLSGLELLPSAEVASERTTVTPATATGNTPIYYKTGDYLRLDFRVTYTAVDGIELGAGVRNLTDRYYILSDGFPEPGRSYYLSVRARY